MNNSTLFPEVSIKNQVEEIQSCSVDFLTEEEKAAIHRLSTIITYPKGAIVVREGQLSTTCYHVIAGCVRQYYLIDGEEKTTSFYTEDQSIISSIGTANPEPSPFFLVCQEKTTLSMMESNEEKELYALYPRIETLCRMSLEQTLKKQQKMLAMYIVSSPEERYRHLLENQPQLINRVPQYQLASYLGVKPESLSRIRKRIAEKQPLK